MGAAPAELGPRAMWLESIVLLGPVVLGVQQPLGCPSLGASLTGGSCLSPGCLTGSLCRAQEPRELGAGQGWSLKWAQRSLGQKPLLSPGLSFWTWLDPPRKV